MFSPFIPCWPRISKERRRRRRRLRLVFSLTSSPPPLLAWKWPWNISASLPPPLEGRSLTSARVWERQHKKTRGNPLADGGNGSAAPRPTEAHHRSAFLLIGLDAEKRSVQYNKRWKSSVNLRKGLSSFPLDLHVGLSLCLHSHCLAGVVILVPSSQPPSR